MFYIILILCFLVGKAVKLSLDNDNNNNNVQIPSLTLA